MQQKAWDIRLIALDLDGTLFTNQKTITPRTLAALTAALKKGVAVVPATGRPAAGLPKELLALPGLRYALTSNGARVWDLAQNAPVAEFLMKKTQAEAGLRVLEDYDCITDLFIEGRRISIASQQASLSRIISPEMLAYMRATRTEVKDICAYLAYDPHSGDWFAAVYKGVKPAMPNYDLFVVDGSTKAVKKNIAGSYETCKGEQLSLKDAGLLDETTGLRGWRFRYGATGICPIGGGYFYISQNYKIDRRQASRLRLYRWTGDASSPFEEVE